MHLVLIKSPLVNSVFRYPLSLSLLTRPQLRKHFLSLELWFLPRDTSMNLPLFILQTGFLLYSIFFSILKQSPPFYTIPKEIDEKNILFLQSYNILLPSKLQTILSPSPNVCFQRLSKGISQLQFRMEGSISASVASKMRLPSHTLDFKRSCSLTRPKLSFHCFAPSFV